MNVRIAISVASCGGTRLQDGRGPVGKDIYYGRPNELEFFANERGPIGKLKDMVAVPTRET